MRISVYPPPAFPASSIYIAVGTLIDVWTLAAFIFYPPETNLGRFFSVAFLILGSCALAAGFILRRAERPVRKPRLAEQTRTAGMHPSAIVFASYRRESAASTDGKNAGGLPKPSPKFTTEN